MIRSSKTPCTHCVSSRLLHSAYLFQSSVHFPPNDLDAIKYCIFLEIFHEVEITFNDIVLKIMRNSRDFLFFRRGWLNFQCFINLTLLRWCISLFSSLLLCLPNVNQKSFFYSKVDVAHQNPVYSGKQKARIKL